jgi:hypothetical protein
VNNLVIMMIIIIICIYFFFIQTDYSSVFQSQCGEFSCESIERTSTTYYPCMRHCNLVIQNNSKEFCSSECPENSFAIEGVLFFFFFFFIKKLIFFVHNIYFYFLFLKESVVIMIMILIFQKKRAI